MFPIKCCKIEVNPPGFVVGVTQFEKSTVLRAFM